MYFVLPNLNLATVLHAPTAGS